jgi:hypothetical protein
MRRTVGLVAAGTALFAAVHSLLASEWFKGRVEQALGPRARNAFYRSAYSGFAGVWLGVMFTLFAKLPNRTLYSVPAPWSWLMRAGQVVGVLMVGDAALRVGAGRFSGMQQALEFATGQEPQPEPPAQGPRLDGDHPARATGGTFAISRHPINLAPTLVVWLQPRMTVAWLTFAIVGTLYSFFGSLLEEARVRRAYPDAYPAYAERAPFFAPLPLLRGRPARKETPADE